MEELPTHFPFFLLFCILEKVNKQIKKKKKKAPMAINFFLGNYTRGWAQAICKYKIIFVITILTGAGCGVMGSVFAYKAGILYC